MPVLIQWAEYGLTRVCSPAAQKCILSSGFACMCHCTFPFSKSQPWEHLLLGEIRCMLACHSSSGRRRHTTCTDSRGAGSFACTPPHVWSYYTHCGCCEEGGRGGGGMQINWRTADEKLLLSNNTTKEHRQKHNTKMLCGPAQPYDSYMNLTLIPYMTSSSSFLPGWAIKKSWKRFQATLCGAVVSNWISGS